MQCPTSSICVQNLSKAKMVLKTKGGKRWEAILPYVYSFAYLVSKSLPDLSQKLFFLGHLWSDSFKDRNSISIWNERKVFHSHGIYRYCIYLEQREGMLIAHYEILGSLSSGKCN